MGEDLENDTLVIDVVQLIRYGEEIRESDTRRRRTNRETLERITDAEGRTLSFVTVLGTAFFWGVRV